MTPNRQTRAQMQFREAVLRNAGHRCQWIGPDGQRCEVTGDEHLTAHHLRPLRVVPSYDPRQGCGLCLPHHREAERRLAESMRDDGDAAA